MIYLLNTGTTVFVMIDGEVYLLTNDGGCHKKDIDGNVVIAWLELEGRVKNK